MPHCSKCDKSQARFKNDGSLCTTCFNELNVGQVRSRDTDGANDDIIQIPSMDMEGKVQDMTVGEMLGLFQVAIKPLQEKVDTLNITMSNKITSLEKRIDILEKEDTNKSEQIAQLTDTVTNIQRALNTIDSKERSKNIIIWGLTEDAITIDGVTLSNDMAKTKFIFKTIGLSESVTELPFTLHRIGKETGEKRRSLKIILKDNKIREIIMKNAPKLKNLSAPLNKIYINRDTHPVYQKEHQRLRRKCNELKKQRQDPENVKLIKGELTVDGVMIDKNIFLK